MKPNGMMKWDKLAVEFNSRSGWPSTARKTGQQLKDKLTALAKQKDGTGRSKQRQYKPQALKLMTELENHSETSTLDDDEDEDVDEMLKQTTYQDLLPEEESEDDGDGDADDDPDYQDEVQDMEQKADYYDKRTTTETQEEPVFYAPSLSAQAETQPPDVPSSQLQTQTLSDIHEVASQTVSQQAPAAVASLAVDTFPSPRQPLKQDKKSKQDKKQSKQEEPILKEKVKLNKRGAIDFTFDLDTPASKQRRTTMTSIEGMNEGMTSRTEMFMMQFQQQQQMEREERRERDEREKREREERMVRQERSDALAREQMRLQHEQSMAQQQQFLSMMMIMIGMKHPVPSRAPASPASGSDPHVANPHV